MELALHRLQSVEEIDFSLQALPEICPRFFIPPLPKKPQDPIMETLKLMRTGTRVLETADHDPPTAVALRSQRDGEAETSEKPTGNLWERAVREARRPSNQVLSWDTQLPSSNHSATSSAFLSQRAAESFSAARHFVDPPFKDPLVQLIQTIPSELFESVRICLTGISSPLHVWDPPSQTFVLRGVTPGKSGFLVVTGMDRVITQSVLNRSLTIGTLVRRLEILVNDLRGKSTDCRPLHAFAHALSSVIHTVKKLITSLAHKACDDNHNADMHTVFKLWTACSDTEVDLVNVASLCRRAIDISPRRYKPLPSDASTLLSAIYMQLDDHLRTHSSRTTAAIFAFLLTATSVDYLQETCRSVGYGTHGAILLSAIDGFQYREDRGITGDEAPEASKTLSTDSDGEDEGSFPCFFTPEMSQALVRAKQSLKLLHAAQPTHPLLTLARTQYPIHWFWTSTEVELAWDSPLITPSQSITSTLLSTSVTDPPTDPPDVDMDEEVFREFKRFDLEPGLGLVTAKSSSRSSADTFDAFLECFPSTLPSLTPSLSDLTELVLSPLAAHIDALSSALVDVLLTRDTYLSFCAHLTLLRSYLLLTSQAFKSRLQQALFCDAPQPPSMHEFGVLQSSRVSASSQNPAKNAWVIGLAPTLTKADWPPVGADLGYSLRTVIIDSLDAEHPERQLSKSHADPDALPGKAQIYEEAEWRLGFVIRDLPVGSGHAKWLDPRSMEALDFLYMDYQPPHPMDVLMPLTTLSKYHRLFAFNLRLMRVENIVHALFRMTTPGSTFPFDTLASSHRLFLNFRFVASSFFTSLSSYVYDSAIRGNFDAFLEKISKSADDAGKGHAFSDVFALADYHSRVMDDILSSCLLRSGQKAVGDLLRSALDIILQFGVLMGDRQRGILEEYQVAEPMEELFAKFRKRVKTLVKVLKALIDKGDVASRVPLGDVQLQVSAETLSLPQAGVAGHLHNLLVRLDVSMWWTSGVRT